MHEELLCAALITSLSAAFCKEKTIKRIFLVILTLKYKNNPSNVAYNELFLSFIGKDKVELQILPIIG